jgi:hypothetical protein
MAKKNIAPPAKLLKEVGGIQVDVDCTTMAPKNVVEKVVMILDRAFAHNQGVVAENYQNTMVRRDKTGLAQGTDFVDVDTGISIEISEEEILRSSLILIECILQRYNFNHPHVIEALVDAGITSVEALNEMTWSQLENDICLTFLERQKVWDIINSYREELNSMETKSIKRHGSLSQDSDSNENKVNNKTNEDILKEEDCRIATKNLNNSVPGRKVKVTRQKSNPVQKPNNIRILIDIFSEDK